MGNFAGIIAFKDRNLEITQRSVQRYIETLRIAEKWIEYDRNLKGSKLTDGNPFFRATGN